MILSNYIGHSKLWCRIGGITFPNNYTVELHLHPGDCTDMSGAIRFAKTVTRHLEDFTLRFVRTLAAGEPDTVYELDQGKWSASERKGRRQ